MADASATRTTTVTTTRTQTTKPYFDPAYLRTIPGILKIVQIIFDIIGLICVASVGYSTRYLSSIGGDPFYEFVAVVGFVITLILLILYLFHVVGYLYKVPWYLIEFIYCLVWAIFFFIASVCVAVYCGRYGCRGRHAGWGAGAFFGFCAMIAYAVDAYFKFRAWRAGEAPQVIRSQTSQTTSSSATVEASRY